MRKGKQTLLFLGGLIIAACSSPTKETPGTLFTSPDYQLLHNKVVQDSFVAEALSPTHLRSTYQSPASQSFSRLVEFKFSLNGKDNELPVGLNHRVVLEPENGQVTLPIITFGQVTGRDLSALSASFLEPNTKVMFRLDLKPVLEAFKNQGFYTAASGEKVYAQDFKGVYIAGGAEPLSWDFENLNTKPQLQLTDPDQDGVYTGTVVFNAHNPDNFTAAEWKLTKDLSGLPRYSSDQVLLDALYNLSLEEMLLDIRPDSTFMAGAKWDGVWTRDISYSILLSLAAIAPEICVNSLRHKLKDGRIVQDTGTGGSWPISSDRMTWALAAWEVYKVTGDQDWLKEAYGVIKKSAEEDLATLVSHETGLMRGESSFLDWRKQTYPLWMQPADIYQSLNLGTNAVHYQTYRILEKMALYLNDANPVYRQTYANIKKGLNLHLWVKEKKYFGQYLYGRQHLNLSPRSEALGEALTVLFDVTTPERQALVLENTPQTNFGVPSIYPYIPEIPPYHNNSVWPFVQAYWTWAAAKEGHTQNVAQSMAALYRAAALFLTNKENLVAQTGDFKGTEINSDRQLWSVAGNLAMVYRVFFGMDFSSDKLSFKPVVPASFSGKKKLTGFTYRKAILTLELEGHGTKLSAIYLNGRQVSKAEIPATLTGTHTLKMVLAGDEGNASPPNTVAHVFSPVAPQVTLEKGGLQWKAVPDAKSYQIFRNGRMVTSTQQRSYRVETPKNGALEYQVLAIGENELSSFLSEPILVAQKGNVLTQEVQTSAYSQAYKAVGFSGAGYAHLSGKVASPLTWTMEAPKAGLYSIDFRYANGNGPTNTDNKAALRTLLLNRQPVGVVVFPQRGVDEWSNWGYSNAWQVYLPKGKHALTLQFETYNQNMNGERNEALIDHIRLVYKGKQ